MKCDALKGGLLTETQKKFEEPKEPAAERKPTRKITERNLRNVRKISKMTSLEILQPKKNRQNSNKYTRESSYSLQTNECDL